MELDTVLITQARTGSSRLPGKVLKKVNGKELLKIHLERLGRCQNVDLIVVATTVEKEDQKIMDLVKSMGIRYYRGSEADVLDRFYRTIESLETTPRWIVRVTSDCPLLDPGLVDQVIQFARETNVDYVGTYENFPDGQDVEVMKYSALQKAWEDARNKTEREHVTPFIRTNSDFNGGTLFKAKPFNSKKDYSSIRMTVDEPEDFMLVSKVIEGLGTGQDWITYAEYILENSLDKYNHRIARNEGYKKSLKGDENE